MDRVQQKNKQRLGRKVHISKVIRGTSERPRMSVFKSNMQLYVQIIDDVKGITLVSASTLDKDLKSCRSNIEGGKKLGQVIGKKAIASGLKTIVFDRNGYKYHGVVKVIADAAREAGLQF